MEMELSINDFQIMKVVGTGTFATVSLVHRKGEPEEVYAIKQMITHKYGDNPGGPEVELRVLELVSNPHLVKMHAAFWSAPKELSLVLEYLSGDELKRHLVRSAYFDEHKTRFYVAQMILAIDCLHQSGVVYRDLKPENIVLDEEGYAKLVDFGLCALGVFDHVSAMGSCGTPEYFAPEMIDGSGHGRALDWYTLGVMTFELLSGRTPFWSRRLKGRDHLFRRIKAGGLCFPDRLTFEARRFIMQLMALEPTARLGSGPGGAQEVKDHMFLEKKNWPSKHWIGCEHCDLWSAVYHRQLIPPIVPKEERAKEEEAAREREKQAKEAKGRPRSPPFLCCLVGIMPSPVRAREDRG